jgi:hypothetical protein
MGQVDEGLTVLAEALEVMNRTGERRAEAELYRLRGELTLKQSGVRSGGSAVTNPQPKQVFTRPLRLPAGDKRNRWSYER